MASPAWLSTASEKVAVDSAKSAHASCAAVRVQRDAVISASRMRLSAALATSMSESARRTCSPTSAEP
eukprot:6419881-Prymnesium_polylepis.1